jgi:NDP-sugar pyrophosphorylase family protein
VTVVFNGDVLTDVDLGAVLAAHRRAKASATIVLFPVPNPSAYGLVETDARAACAASSRSPSQRRSRPIGSTPGSTCSTRARSS